MKLFYLLISLLILPVFFFPSEGKDACSLCTLTIFVGDKVVPDDNSGSFVLDTVVDQGQIINIPVTFSIYGLLCDACGDTALQWSQGGLILDGNWTMDSCFF